MTEQVDSEMQEGTAHWTTGSKTSESCQGNWMCPMHNVHNVICTTSNMLTCLDLVGLYFKRKSCCLNDLKGHSYATCKNGLQ